MKNKANLQLVPITPPGRYSRPLSKRQKSDRQEPEGLSLFSNGQSTTGKNSPVSLSLSRGGTTICLLGRLEKGKIDEPKFERIENHLYRRRYQTADFEMAAPRAVFPPVRILLRLSNQRLRTIAE
jgi:hypothetical protein